MCGHTPKQEGKMNVRDTELTVEGGKGYIHTHTRRPWRISDGVKHPVKTTPVDKENENESVQGLSDEQLPVD